MTASLWLRLLSGVLALFTAGHTLGTAVPRVTRGPDQAAIFAAMQKYVFAVNGFDRSYWDFYRGFALTISVLLLMMTVMSWSLASLARTSAKALLPMAITVLLACVGLLVISCAFFFTAPIAMSAAAVIMATGAVVQMARDT